MSGRSLVRYGRGKPLPVLSGNGYAKRASIRSGRRHK